MCGRECICYLACRQLDTVQARRQMTYLAFSLSLISLKLRHHPQERQPQREPRPRAERQKKKERKAGMVPSLTMQLSRRSPPIPSNPGPGPGQKARPTSWVTHTQSSPAGNEMENGVVKSEKEAGKEKKRLLLSCLLCFRRQIARSTWGPVRLPRKQPIYSVAAPRDFVAIFFPPASGQNGNGTW